MKTRYPFSIDVDSDGIPTPPKLPTTGDYKRDLEERHKRLLPIALRCQELRDRLRLRSDRVRFGKLAAALCRQNP